MGNLIIAMFERLRPMVTGGVEVLTPWQQTQPAGSGQFSPHGSVYHSSDVLPTFRPGINEGAIPPASNFSAVAFPLPVWNKNASYGNSIGVYQDQTRGAPPNR